MTPLTPILVFRLGDQQYGLLIDDVVEVAAMVSVAQVPAASPALLGIANRHGAVLPLLDLRQVFGLSPLVVTWQTLFIVTQQGDQHAGLVVDEVYQVQYLPLGDAWQNASTGQYIRAVITDGDRLLQIIALDALFAVHLAQLSS